VELKQAMEVATADLDVRPGFLGDVMAGGRRRHTRRLVALTASVALIAGLVSGVVLSRSPDGPSTGDPRLAAAPSGDLAGDEEFIARTLVIWRDAVKPSEPVTEVTGSANVFWANNTPDGPAALVVQEVRVRDAFGTRLQVGLVAGGALADRELVGSQETGLFRVGQDSSTYVALGLGQKIFWSTTPVRGPDNRLRREWRQADNGPGDVAVVTAKTFQRPVFVRAVEAPAADDFTGAQLKRKESPARSQAGLGWSGQRCASDSRPGLNPKSQSPMRDLQERGLLDYLNGDDSTGKWSVCAWTPDMRFVQVFESYGQLYAVLYDMNGVFSTAVVGGPVVKDNSLPVRVVLPDSQGTIVADYDSYIGPEKRKDVWVVPATADTVTVQRNGMEETVPLR
jgi:hypothetical protein